MLSEEDILTQHATAPPPPSPSPLPAVLDDIELEEQPLQPPSSPPQQHPPKPRQPHKATSSTPSMSSLYIKGAIIMLICISIVAIIAFVLIRRQEVRIRNKEHELATVKEAREAAKATIEQQQRIIDKTSLALEQCKKELKDMTVRATQYKNLAGTQGPSKQAFVEDIKLNDGTQSNHMHTKDARKQIQQAMNTKRATAVSPDAMTQQQQDALDADARKEIEDVIPPTTIQLVDSDDGSEAEEAPPFSLGTGTSKDVILTME